MNRFSSFSKRLKFSKGDNMTPKSENLVKGALLRWPLSAQLSPPKKDPLSHSNNFTYVLSLIGCLFPGFLECESGSICRSNGWYYGLYTVARHFLMQIDIHTKPGPIICFVVKCFGVSLEVYASSVK